MSASLFNLCLVAILLLVTSAAPAEKEESKRDYYRDGNCYVSGYTFRNGEVFSIPGFSQCLKYRCDFGGWDVAQEACDVKGQCHPVGSTFESDCVTYNCHKSHRNGGSWYQPITISSRCKDYYGNCRNPGEFFPYAINGRLYQHCSCTSRADGYTSYHCQY